MATIAGGSASAPSVVLLHGFLGDRRDLEPLRRAILSSPNFCVNCIAVDLPGHGDYARSDGASSAIDTVKLAIEAHCSAASKIILIGYSMGGRLALQLAAQSAALRGRVAGIIVLSSNPGIEAVDKRAERAARDDALAARLRKMAPIDFHAWLRDEWYAAPLWGALREHPQFGEMVARRLDGVRPADRAASLERESVGKQQPLWEWLANNNSIPFLLIAGAKDSAYAPMVDRLLNAEATTPPRAILVDGAAHALLLEAPDKVAELCTAFITRLPREPSSLQPESCGAGSLHIFDARIVPFILPLTAPLPLSRGSPLISRNGHLLIISANADHQHDFRIMHGMGEVCPLPCFHTESGDHAKAQLEEVCKALSKRVVPFELMKLGGAMRSWLKEVTASVPDRRCSPLLPSVRCAVEFALLHLIARMRQPRPSANKESGVEAPMAKMLARGGIGRRADERATVAMQSHVRLNGLMARNETEAAAAALSGDGGGSNLARMRTWKLKVGGGDPVEEGKRVATLLRGCEALGLRLRLDANQAWDEQAARTFCGALRAEWTTTTTTDADEDKDAAPSAKRSRVAETRSWPPMPLEFCEEPLKSDQLATLPRLYESEGLRYALDESVTSVAAEMLSDGGGGEKLEELRGRLRAVGCAALVLKPTLLGGAEVTAALAAEAANAGIPIVLTSAFESGVSHAHIAILASVLGGPSVAHGLSTFERLTHDVLMPSFASCVVGGDLVDVARAEAALNATADLMAK